MCGPLHYLRYLIIMYVRDLREQMMLNLKIQPPDIPVKEAVIPRKV